VSRRAGRSPFVAIRSEGGLLPHDLLQRIAAREARLPGVRDADYGILAHEREGEVVNRAWSRLLGAWAAFRDALAREPAGTPATRVTRERWLLPLFQELGYGRLTGLKEAIPADGRAFPVSHLHEPTRTPVHLLGARVPLDTRTEAVKGAARTTPHGLVQDLLNRSDAHDWAFLSNGLVLRVLRDNRSITRQAYLEFDLEQVFEDELFSEFRVLWLVGHESRVRREADAACFLEQWFERAREEGVRARDRLRDGVQRAIERLGSGFLRHRANARLQRALADGALTEIDYYRQLLRLVYRLIFVFVTEDRGVLLDPRADAAARARYADWYATTHLRDFAQRRRGGPHGDLWRRLALVLERLHDGCAALGLPALGSFLWHESAVPALRGLELSNEDLLAAARALVEIEDGGVRRPVSWAEVGADELGSVYESLLELRPRIERQAGAFELAIVAGNERKTTGSYYTPTSLVDCLLDSALEPVLDEKMAAPDPEAAILDTKVCDPACGSGHFLVAAAHRIARRLALVRSGDDEPSPEAYRRALRDVVGRCIFGVDLNPMALELCKVSLWLEAVDPGRPLSFLDAHLQVGNSLLGTTPALLAKGLPDEAFVPLEGDDKDVAKRLKKQNREERKTRQKMLFARTGQAEALAALRAAAEAVERGGDEDLAGVKEKAAAFERLRGSEGYRRARLAADAWCAAFVWRKVPGELEDAAVTHERLRILEREGAVALPATAREVERVAGEEGYRFFHWHLAFPQVFRVPGEGEGLGQGAGKGKGGGTGGKGEKPENEETGWSGGFDVVLGNPPWERVKIEEQEFFASRRPDVASSKNAAARKSAIAALKGSAPELFGDWTEALRRADAEARLLRETGRYPLCGRGDINTYAIFAELNRSLITLCGRVGCLVPSGIATDDTTKGFFGSLVHGQQLESLYDFQTGEGLFARIGHARYKFCLLTLTGKERPVQAADFLFFARHVGHLVDEGRHFQLAAEDFAILSPNTHTCPTFRSKRDAEITKAIYSRVPVLVREVPTVDSPWGVDIRQGLYHVTNDTATGELLDSRVDPALDTRRLRAVYEAKLIHQYNHRFADYAAQRAASESTALPQSPDALLADASFGPTFRYWTQATILDRRIAGWSHGWLLAWRDICRSTDERTVIATLLPRLGVAYTLRVLVALNASAREACVLLSNLNAFTLDYVCRQLNGGTHLTNGIAKQLPVLRPSAGKARASWVPCECLTDWILPRVLELTYTAWDLEPFARDCGYDGPPYRWDEGRRFLLRCELDAAFFHLYGLPRDDVDYVMETFPIVKRNDEAAHGEYRTKRVILEIYDAMQRAIETGVPYATRLDPPPADARVAHPPRAAAPARVARRPPFRFVESPAEDEKYTKLVPLYSVRAAAGGFVDPQRVETEGWVEPPTARKLARGMFVAEVVGTSMLPRIPERAWCLFRGPVEGSRDGRIVLAEHRSIADPETGASYTVKRWRSEKVSDGAGGWRHARVVLEPLNADAKPIVLEGIAEDEIAVSAELIEVLPTEVPVK